MTPIHNFLRFIVKCITRTVILKAFDIMPTIPENELLVVDERLDAAARRERRLARQQRLFVANARPGPSVWVKLCDIIPQLEELIWHHFSISWNSRVSNRLVREGGEVDRAYMA